jgi:hypothetical protein
MLIIPEVNDKQNKIKLFDGEEMWKHVWPSDGMSSF